MFFFNKPIFYCIFFIAINCHLNAQSLEGYPVNPSPGCSDGAIYTWIYSGIPPYTFEWNSGSRSSYLTNVPSGNYCVTVTDATCCQSIRCFQLNDSGIIEISQSQNPTGDGLCDGSIDVTATGAGAPFSFEWSNGETTEDISNLCTGTYTVTITSQKGCTKVLGAYIEKSCYGDPALMTESPAPLIVTPNVKSTSNSSFNNGSIMLNIQGGASPYYFNWSGPNGYRAREQKIENLSVGTYCATVTDGCGQSYSKCFTINDCSQAAPITISLNTDRRSCNIIYDDLPGTTITATPRGGTPPFALAWSTGSNLNPIGNVRPGFYYITVTDSKSCKAEANVEVSDGYSEIRNECLITRFCNGQNLGSIVRTDEGTIDNSQLRSNCRIILRCKKGQDVTLQGTRVALSRDFQIANCVTGEGCQFTLNNQTFFVITTLVSQIQQETRLEDVFTGDCPLGCKVCVRTTFCALTGQILSQTRVSLDKCPPPIRPRELTESEIMATIPSELDGIKMIRTKAELDSLIRSFREIAIDSKNGVILSDNNSLTDKSTNTAYQVYPNPFSNSIYLDYDSEDTKSVTVEITNLYGQTIFSKRLQSVEGKNSHSLQLDDNCANGVYIVKLKYQDSILFTTKLVKAQ